jgi:hypothetical protein
MTEAERYFFGAAKAAMEEAKGKCRFCGCKGGSCKTLDGDHCDLVGELQNRCNGASCVYAHSRDKKSRRWARKTVKKGKTA